MTKWGVVIAMLACACGDNDHLGLGELLVTPLSGLHTTEAGGTARFSVSLTSEPDRDLDITLASTNRDEGVVSPDHFGITQRTWNLPRVVTVTGVDDDRADGPQSFGIRVSATGSILEISDVVVDVTNDDDDVAAASVVPTLGLVTSETGTRATFDVALLAQPTAPVAIPVASSNTGEGVVDTAMLVFDPDTWGIAQTVTITGVDDAISDGAQPYTIVLGPAASGDPAFDGMDPDDVQVTNVDDDVEAIVVTPTSGLVTTEASGTATFSVVLATQPTADVTTVLGSTAPSEATADVASLTFTPATWNVPQVVTVTGHDDHVVDGDRPFTITLAPATSADAHYAGIDPDDVTGVNIDDDVRGITVAPTSGLVTSERGKSDWFRVVLNTQPVANVTVPLVSSDPTEGTVFPAALTFTPANWNVAQTATVTGVDDNLPDGNIAYTIQTQPAVSADPVYAGFDAADVAVTNIDNDTAGITIDPVAGLLVSEFGDADTFTIVLTSRPTANVRVTFASSDVTEGFVFPAQVTFTPGNWNTPRTITVIGVDDLATDGNQPFTIITGAATSADAAYNGIDPPDVAVTNIDNETAQVYVKARPLLVTSETGTTATFRVRLTKAPAAPVTCPLATTDPTEGIANPAGVTFTSGNFGFQTVTITGIDDAVQDGDQLYSIVTAACTSADPAYSGADPPDVACVNRDND
jgi:hypothetical protein